jgi:succinate dehydrogenase iron-sulfur subunit
VRLRVFRWSPEASAARFDEFRVEPAASATVLDALVEVRESEAPDLAFRYACRVGMCGSCALVVDGRERWACRTRLVALGRRGPDPVVTVRPLYHFPLIRDLVVDMRPFVEKMQAVGAAFVPRRPVAGTGPGGGAAAEPAAAIGSQSAERQAIDAAIECIGCGACVSACTMVRWNPRFPGPAALNRAFTLVSDSRDGGLTDRVDALFGEDGVLRCHGQAQCTAVCPMELSPTDAILTLRRRAALALFSRG